MKNQDESDIDCGGHMCPKCMDTKTCSHSNDCLSGNCDNNICAPPETCTDSIKNQDESDIDCGGLICQKCMDTKTCSHSDDCLSGNCDNNICAPPESCTDKMKNQDESDIDCGGLICPKCMDGKICNTSSDCDSNQCGANVCQTCSLNGFSNGGFESGNSNGWTIGGGVRTGVSSSQILPQDFLPNGPLYIANIAASHSAVVTNDSDPLLGTLMPGIVHSGQNAFRIEDLIKGGYASVISRQINSYFCLDIYFAWLAVVENGDHTSNESSIMIVELKDTTNSDTLISRRYDAGAGSTGVDNRFRQKDAYFYTPSWQIEHLAIGSDRIGHNFTLTVLAADCKPAGHVGYVYIDSFSGIAP
ncbi:hypothetical protein I4U23_012160 [Adineta vaga]|nr:hypothetical protein I4U23_012160 [Adineta vaga]